MKVDVVILGALVEELGAMKDLLRTRAVSTFRYPHSPGNYDIYLLKNGLRVATAPHMEMGQVNAAIGTAKMLAALHPRLVLLVGIAAIMEKRTADRASAEHYLGDIVVSDQIIDYALEKIKNGKDEHRWRHYQSCPHLIREIKEHATKVDWANELGENPENSTESPRIHVGHVFSGNHVVADEKRKLSLLSDRPKTIAIEMEAAGVAAMLSLNEMPVPFVMIKSLCDWADDTKNDEWHSYCCQAAALFVAYIVEEIIPDYLSRYSTYHDHEVFRRQAMMSLTCFLESQPAHVPFLGPMAKDILSQAISEIEALSQIERGPKYSVEINSGRQFLNRARSLFSLASRVYVTSLDFVSQFWIEDSPKSIDIAKQYLDNHAKSGDKNAVTRLFVFSTPESAHIHGKRLDAHVMKFANTLVCSKADYINIIKHAIDHHGESYSRFLNRDFSILYYTGANGDSAYFSSLDPNTMDLDLAQNSVTDLSFDCFKIVEMFDEFSNIESGTIGSEFNVLKWEKKHWNTSVWVSHLKAMFGEPTSEVFHYVTLNIDEDEYRAISAHLARMKYGILRSDSKQTEALAVRHGIKDVWLLERIKHKPVIRDAYTDAELYYPTARKLKAILAFQFTEVAKLRSFLEAKESSKFRLELFSLLGGDTADMLKLMDVSIGTDLEKLPNSSIYYKILEKLASLKIRRYDFRNDMMIRQLVEFAPPDF